MPHFWKYDEVEPRDDVKTNLPDDWRLRVYKIVSGDTGKTYYVQVLIGKNARTHTEVQTIYICNCPEGIFKAPLSILGLGYPCKHAEHLAEFLKERKS